MAKRKSRVTRFQIAFDTHGDQINKAAEETYFDFQKQYKPDIRGHGGDFCDLRALRIGASKEELADGVSRDMYAARRFLQRLDPHFVLFGNHDHRLTRAAHSASNGFLRDAAHDMLQDLYQRLDGVKVYPYCKRSGVHRLGNLNVIHGYNHGMYAAKKAALSYGNVLMGHVHTPQRIEIEDIDESVGYSSGCLCDLNMPYTVAALGTLRWRHGWAYGTIDSKGHTTVHLAVKRGGTWHTHGA